MIDNVGDSNYSHIFDLRTAYLYRNSYDHVVLSILPNDFNFFLRAKLVARDLIFSCDKQLKK